MSDSEGDKLTEVTFRDFTPENEAELRLLNSAIFPIRYSVSVCRLSFPLRHCPVPFQPRKGLPQSLHPTRSHLSSLPLPLPIDDTPGQILRGVRGGRARDTAGVCWH